MVHHDWPKSGQWPVAFAGISGGATCAQWLGAILAQTHSLNIRGFFLSGINEDQMPEALKTNPVPPGFVRLPIWISSGINDRIATPVAGGAGQRFTGSHRFSEHPLESIQW